MRVGVRVKPGASKNQVAYDQESGQLVVWVSESAVDGRATQAALEAVARVLGLRRSEVTLRSGATSRSKVFDVPDAAAESLSRLGPLGPG